MINTNNFQDFFIYQETPHYSSLEPIEKTRKITSLITGILSTLYKIYTQNPKKDLLDTKIVPLEKTSSEDISESLTSTPRDCCEILCPTTSLDKEQTIQSLRSKIDKQHDAYQNLEILLTNHSISNEQKTKILSALNTNMHLLKNLVTELKNFLSNPNQQGNLEAIQLREQLLKRNIPLISRCIEILKR